jgi:hypothetical protein
VIAQLLADPQRSLTLPGDLYLNSHDDKSNHENLCADIF